MEQRASEYNYYIIFYSLYPSGLSGDKIQRADGIRYGINNLLKTVRKYP